MQPTTSDDTSVLANGSTTTLSLDDTLLEVIRAAMADGPAPAGLAPDTYARDHAAFEELSDQRRLITDRLREIVTARGDGPISVLSVGCGDGSVDVALADALTAQHPGRAVRYVGVEPFSGSAAGFARRMTTLEDRAGFDTEVYVTTFEDAPLIEQFDVITFVHSMYYVRDVADALTAAHALLKPGGELLVLSAPRGVLNKLVGVLAPSVEGHRQWFSDDVSAGFFEAGLDLEEATTLDACVDLTDADDDVLDFTVQARLTDDLRPLVLAYLAEVAVPGAALALPHPVDLYRVTRDS